MALLRKRVGVSAAALEFAILTAARTGEVIGAAWDEVDFQSRIWCVPGVRMKGGRDHRVPLSVGALSILKRMNKLKHDNFVFPSGRVGKPLSNMALLTLLRRMNRTDITVHGFRSTFRDWTAEGTDYSREVAEMALGHMANNQVEAAYRRGDLFEKRQRLMDEWAEHCAAATTLRAPGSRRNRTAAADVVHIIDMARIDCATSQQLVEPPSLFPPARRQSPTAADR